MGATFDYDHEDDFIHRRAEATLTDDAGRGTTIRLVDADAEIYYPISDRLSLIDVVGHAEMAWPPDLHCRQHRGRRPAPRRYRRLLKCAGATPGRGSRHP